MTIEECYIAICRRLGIRPITYIYRDCWRRYEILGQLQWFWIGVISLLIIQHYSLGMIWLGVEWGIYFWGYLNGHFFFGTKIVDGQTQPTEDEMRIAACIEVPNVQKKRIQPK